MITPDYVSNLRSASMVADNWSMRAIEDQSTAKANYALFIWPILRGIALVVALWAFISDLPVLLYRGKMGTSWPVFGIASFALIAMTPKRETLPIIDEGSVKGAKRGLPEWPLLSYCAITGLGFNWACVFLWFSRRYALFSAPVVGVLSLILVLYAASGVIVAWLTEGNWRTGLLVFAMGLCVLGPAVFRLGLLR